MLSLSGRLVDFDPFQNARPCHVRPAYGGWCTDHNKPLCPGCGVCPRDPMRHEVHYSLRQEGRIDRGPYGSNLVGRPYSSGAGWHRVDVYAPYTSPDEASRYRVQVLGSDDFTPVVHRDDYAAECSCCWLGFAHSEKKHAAAIGAALLGR
jgi:hypothetical protein